MNSGSGHTLCSTFYYKSGYQIDDTYQLSRFLPSSTLTVASINYSSVATIGGKSKSCIIVLLDIGNRQQISVVITIVYSIPLPVFYVGMHTLVHLPVWSVHLKNDEMIVFHAHDHICARWTKVNHKFYFHTYILGVGFPTNGVAAV